METGDKSTQSSTRAFTDLEGSFVVAHLRYDGLSLLISDSGHKQLKELIHTEWLASKDPGYLIDECQKLLSEKHLNLSRAAGVQWLFSVSKICLIPDILYEQGYGERLLNHTSRLEQGERVFSDFWSRRDVVGVYALPEQLLEYVQQKNSNSNIAHNSYAINSLYNHSGTQDDFAFLQVSHSFAELYLVQKSKVVFYNQFPHDVSEDLLYYVLFALEQNRILAPEVTLYTSGNVVKGQELHSLLSRYIGKVEGVKLDSKFTNPQQISSHRLREAANLIAVL